MQATKELEQIAMVTPDADDLWMALSFADGAEVRAKVPPDFLRWIREQDSLTRTAFAIRMNRAVRGLIRELRMLFKDRSIPTLGERTEAARSIAHGGECHWLTPPPPPHPSPLPPSGERE